MRLSPSFHLTCPSYSLWHHPWKCECHTHAHTGANTAGTSRIKRDLGVNICQCSAHTAEVFQSLTQHAVSHTLASDTQGICKPSTSNTPATHFNLHFGHLFVLWRRFKLFLLRKCMNSLINKSTVCASAIGTKTYGSLWVVDLYFPRLGHEVNWPPFWAD